MMLPGIGGSLFPSRFLADGFPRLCRIAPIAGDEDAAFRHLTEWWRRVQATCGTATGLRAIFDLAAMPLAALLGFRARDAVFARGRVSVRLESRRSTAVGLIVLPWAARPSRLWRDLAVEARAFNADWCLLFAPPFLSVVDARGRGVRRAIDFELPAALDARSFPAFWTVCRAGTFDRGTTGSGAHRSALDELVSHAARFSDTVRRDLQSGVVTALDAIGPALQAGGNPATRFVESLTVVYRVLFLLFAESRDLLPRYPAALAPAYALGRLCRAAAHGETPGLWDGLAAITRLSRSGCETADVIVKPFNGHLFARAAAPSLELRDGTRRPTDKSTRRDTALATALVALGTRRGPGGREDITYADLGVEQLGAVYERVLDLDPSHGQRRKETGTFYTPQPLADFVVRRTLAPLVCSATTDDILNLRVVDPAMGSGAFLVAACRFLAHAYEAALINEGRCAETDLDDDARAGIRRLIATRCLTGVDANPVAVQLARLSLWLTSLAKDKPLSFLDDRLRVGDSLIGAGPDDLWRRPPTVRRRRGETSAAPLLEAAGLDVTLGGIVRPLRQLRESGGDTIAQVRAQEQIWADLNRDASPLAAWRLACDIWCARWFRAPGDAPASPQELAAMFDLILRGDRSGHHRRMDDWIAHARDAGRRRGFFHWPIEFADVFYDADAAPRNRPGFDAVIGNPPWEMLGRHQSDTTAFLRQSGCYSSCDRGHLNLYQAFLERSLSLTRPGGRTGLILPWGLASDAGARALRERLLERAQLDTFVGFDNSEGLFPIHRGFRFAVVVASPGGAGGRETRVRCGIRSMDQIEDLPGQDDPGDRAAFPVRLTADRIRRISGPSLRIPDARDPDEIAWLEAIASKFPRLGDAGGWRVTFGRELNATDNRASFGSTGLRVLEGKNIAPFRADAAPASAFIDASEARRLLPDGRHLRARLAYRDVSASSNRFSLIAAVIPPDVVTTHTLFCLREPVPIRQQHFLCGIFNSDLMNRFVRALMGSHVTTDLVEGLPVPRWDGSAAHRRIAALARRLARSAGAAALAELNEHVTNLYKP